MDLKRFINTLVFILAFAPAYANLLPFPVDTVKSRDTLPLPAANIKVSKDSLEAQVVYSCNDSINFDVAERKVYLYGDAKVEYKNIRLAAEFIIFDWKNNLLIAEGRTDSFGNAIGDPIFTEDQEYQAKKIVYNYRTKKGKITQLITQEGEGYVHGSKVKKNEIDELFVKDAKYTTCDLEDPHYEIAVSKLKLIPDKKIISGPAIVKIEHVPTPLFLPFGFFPIKKGRASGILLPEYGEDQERGFFLDNGGYFFALNDYLDLTLRGGIYSRGSWKGFAAVRYNLLYKFRGETSLSYSNFQSGDPVTTSFSVRKDFFARWSHFQDPKARPNSTFSANVNFGTSTYHQLNSYNPNDVLANTYSSSISYSKRWYGKPYNLTVNLNHSQNTQTRRVDLSLPSVTFGVGTFNPLKRRKQIGDTRWYERINVSYTFTADNKISETDTVLFREQTLKKMNNGIRHSIPVSTSFKVFKYFNLSPNFNYTELWYLKTIRRNWHTDNVSDTSYVKTDTVSGFDAARFFSTGASLSTYVYGMLNFKRGKIKAIRHVMSPQLSFTYQPDFSGHSWNYYREYKADSAGNKQQYSIYEGRIYGGPPGSRLAAVGMGIGNILEMKVFSKKDTVNQTKKIKLLEALSIGASYNFVADSFNLSDIGISGRTTLFEKLALNFGATYTPYVIDENNVRLNRFQWEENKKLARFTSGTLRTGTTFNSKKRTVSPQELSAEEAEMLGRYHKKYNEFYMPWNFGFDYGLTVSRSFVNQKDTTQYSQYLSFNFSFSPTSKWNIKVNSGYSFETKDLTYTYVSIDRDLHCWEMKFNWIPFGMVKYSVQINVKSSMLSDLKITKKKNWGGYY